MRDLQVSIWVESKAFRTEIAEVERIPLGGEVAPDRPGRSPLKRLSAGRGQPRDERRAGGDRSRIPTRRTRDFRLGRRESPMLFGNRRPRKSDRAATRSRDIHRPRGEPLEARLLWPSIWAGPRLNLPHYRDGALRHGVGGQPDQPAEPAGASPTSATCSGNGYDDFVIGAPTVSTSPGTIGTGIDAAAYLVFGSQTITGTGMSTVTDWIGKNGSNAFNYTAERPGRRPGPGDQPRQPHSHDPDQPDHRTAARFPVRGRSRSSTPSISRACSARRSPDCELPAARTAS